MSRPVSEITFSPMPTNGDKGKPAPSAVNMPGWKLIADAINDAVSTSGLSVNVIAENTGLTRQYIYSMMNGTCNPGMDKVERVLEAAGVSFAEWISDQSLYGRDKRLHVQIQLLLDQKGESAIALRRAVAGLMALAAEQTKSGI